MIRSWHLSCFPPAMLNSLAEAAAHGWLLISTPAHGLSAWPSGRHGRQSRDRRLTHLPSPNAAGRSGRRPQHGGRSHRSHSFAVVPAPCTSVRCALPPAPQRPPAQATLSRCAGRFCVSDRIIRATQLRQDSDLLHRHAHSVPKPDVKDQKLAAVNLHVCHLEAAALRCTLSESAGALHRQAGQRRDVRFFTGPGATVFPGAPQPLLPWASAVLCTAQQQMRAALIAFLHKTRRCAVSKTPSLANEAARCGVHCASVS